jgi:hypothetical protein
MHFLNPLLNSSPGLSSALSSQKQSKCSFLEVREEFRKHTKQQEKHCGFFSCYYLLRFYREHRQTEDTELKRCKNSVLNVFINVILIRYVYCLSGIFKLFHILTLYFLFYIAIFPSILVTVPKNILSFVRLQVLTAASMKIRAFWDLVPCYLLGVDRHFRSTYCLHHRSDDGGSTHL